MAGLTESVVEDVALAWLESLGYAVKHGPNITPGSETLTLTLSQWERENYSQVELADRLRQAFARPNPNLPANAIEDTFREAVGLQERLLKEFESRRLSRVSIEVVE